MQTKNKPFDKIFFGIVITLVVLGLFFFVSASLGVFAKSQGKFWNVLFSQFALGVVGGSILLWAALKVPYLWWRKYSFYLFLGSIAVTALVFVPGLGMRHGGATRWLSLGPVSFQPAELLKIAFIMYFAGWLSWVKDKINGLKFGLIPLVIMLGIVALVLFRQPDTKSFMLMSAAALGMLLIAGVPWKQLFLTMGILVLGLGALLMYKPYLKDRMFTFLDPSRDPSGSSYQLQQGLIAVGSGGVFGRGYGQSVQKFSYLPEPQGDSIFAVMGEEIGFVGCTLIVLLYSAFFLRGLRIARNAPDTFSQLFVAGAVIMLTAQSFLNIASILGLFPLTGVPLVFISQGGTSLAFSLALVGIILNISRFQKKAV